ncbi:MAG: hypothetical protein V1495_09620 [Pseudomonadota bacterium]
MLGRRKTKGFNGSALLVAMVVMVVLTSLGIFLMAGSLNMKRAVRGEYQAERSLDLAQSTADRAAANIRAKFNKTASDADPKLQNLPPLSLSASELAAALATATPIPAGTAKPSGTTSTRVISASTGSITPVPLDALDIAGGIGQGLTFGILATGNVGNSLRTVEAYYQLVQPGPQAEYLVPMAFAAVGVVSTAKKPAPANSLLGSGTMDFYPFPMVNLGKAGCWVTSSPTDKYNRCDVLVLSDPGEIKKFRPAWIDGFNHRLPYNCFIKATDSTRKLKCTPGNFILSGDDGYAVYGAAAVWPKDPPVASIPPPIQPSPFPKILGSIPHPPAFVINRGTDTKYVNKVQTTLAKLNLLQTSGASARRNLPWGRTDPRLRKGGLEDANQQVNNSWAYDQSWIKANSSETQKLVRPTPSPTPKSSHYNANIDVGYLGGMTNDAVNAPDTRKDRNPETYSNDPKTAVTPVAVEEWVRLRDTLLVRKESVLAMKESIVREGNITWIKGRPKTDKYWNTYPTYVCMGNLQALGTFGAKTGDDGATADDPRIVIFTPQLDAGGNPYGKGFVIGQGFKKTGAIGNCLRSKTYDSRDNYLRGYGIMVVDNVLVKTYLTSNFIFEGLLLATGVNASFMVGSGQSTTITKTLKFPDSYRETSAVYGSVVMMDTLPAALGKKPLLKYLYGGYWGCVAPCTQTGVPISTYHKLMVRYSHEGYLMAHKAAVAYTTWNADNRFSLTPLSRRVSQELVPTPTP